jgi:hypothetical protein
MHTARLIRLGFLWFLWFCGFLAFWLFGFLAFLAFAVFGFLAFLAFSGGVVLGSSWFWAFWLSGSLIFLVFFDFDFLVLLFWVFGGGVLVGWVCLVFTLECVHRKRGTLIRRMLCAGRESLLAACSFVDLSVCSSVCVFVRRSACLFVGLRVRSSICVFVRRSACSFVDGLRDSGIKRETRCRWFYGAHLISTLSHPGGAPTGPGAGLSTTSIECIGSGAIQWAVQTPGCSGSFVLGWSRTRPSGVW